MVYMFHVPLLGIVHRKMYHGSLNDEIDSGWYKSEYLQWLNILFDLRVVMRRALGHAPLRSPNVTLARLNIKLSPKKSTVNG